MAWSMRGQWVEVCSCKVVCRCNFGPAEPDQEWCSAMLAFEIAEGESGGVDLTGARVALGAQLPGDFLGGIDLARLYVDPATSDDQRRELEAILQGQRGGVWEGISGMIGQWLPTESAEVEVGLGDSPSMRVGDFAEFSFSRVKTESGKQAVVTNAPLSEGFAVETMELASATGRFTGPDMRAWETLGYGAVVPFDWSF
jgi:hypothetical protein